MRRSLLAIVLLFAALGIAAPRLNHASSDVAFMGDSLTQGWAFPRVNLGIFGQTTQQMLARFPGQVASRPFRKVILLGGTNDTLLGIPPEVTLRNLAAMVDLARQAHIEPILAEVPPIYRSGGRYLPAVQTLNTQIIALAQAKHVPIIDYYDALATHQSSYSDGTHLKRRGYLRMEWALLKTTNPF